MAIKSEAPANGVRVFLSAGEASGDAYAAALIRLLRQRKAFEGSTFEGIGGPRGRAEGMTLWADSSHWGAIGIYQALRVAPSIVRNYYRAKRRMTRGKPGLFIPIDFGYVNIRLSSHAKGHGWRVLYFVPPGSWRKDRQGKDLARLTDAIVTPFSWSAEILQKMGARAYWFGHPVKQLVRERKVSMGEDLARPRTTLAILPGSRIHEIEANLPVLAKAVEGFEAEAVFALAPTLDPVEVSGRWRELSGRSDRFVQNDTAGVLLQARAALVCSGTATLEAALCGCPMVVLYQLTPAMVREADLLRVKRPKFIALPNILLDRFAVPEYVERDGVQPEVVREQLDKIWSDGPERTAQLESFAELEAILGPDDAITRAAELAGELS